MLLLSKIRRRSCAAALRWMERKFFFFPEFRNDDETSGNARKESWNKKIREVMGKPRVVS